MFGIVSNPGWLRTDAYCSSAALSALSNAILSSPSATVSSRDAHIFISRLDCGSLQFGTGSAAFAAPHSAMVSAMVIEVFILPLSKDSTQSRKDAKAQRLLFA